MSLLTVNVTCLTKDRLLEVLRAADASSASVVALQETRHARPLLWASKLAKQSGWLSCFSSPPPLQRALSVRQGGCALFWRSRQKTSPFQVNLDRDKQHRVCGRVFGNWAVVSFYGDAAVADVPTVSAVLREAAALQRPCVVLGDFNWRPAYWLALRGPLA